MDMMLFIVLALFVLSGLDALWSPRRTAARKPRRAPRMAAQRRTSRSGAHTQPAWQNRCPNTRPLGNRAR